MIDAKMVEELREDGAYLLWFEDAEMQPILFSGAGARDAAIRAYEARSLAWNCVLFVDHKALATASLAREGAEVERLREAKERLTKALEPFAKAASDYERKGEFFSNNVELVLRVSVFAAPEYHNSTAVQVGDLRRARSELEAGHE